MKPLSKPLNVLFALLIGSLITLPTAFAQNFQGIATYRSDRDMSNFNFQSNDMPAEMIENMKAQLKKQFQKDYELKFDQSASTWAEAESLDGGAATASAGGMVMTISMGGGTTYKNTANNSLITQTEAFGKQFLITDELEERAWEMTGNSKKIGNYTVYEATFDNISERRTISVSDEDKTTETVMDTTRITVWYTPEIPVPHGPEEYWGLPGLILEMTDGNVTYLCTKVVLNPEKGVEINKPTKGKKVTADEFDEELAKMEEKMMKKFSGGEDGEHTMTIQIGG